MLVQLNTTKINDETFKFTDAEIMEALIKTGKIPQSQKGADIEIILDHAPTENTLFVYRKTTIISNKTFTEKQHELFATTLQELHKKKVISLKLSKELTKNEVSLYEVFKTPRETTKDKFQLSQNVWFELIGLFDSRNLKWI